MIVLIFITIISSGIGVIYSLIYWIFKHKPDMTARTVATKKSHKHKKDVVIRMRHVHDAYYKNLTKAVYIYKVNGKEYKIRDISPTIPGEMPRMIGVRYIKDFPQFACIEEIASTDEFRYLLNAMLSFFITAMCLLMLIFLF